MSQELLEKYIQTGNVSALNDLLHSNPELSIVKTSHYISPLMLSCYYKKPEISDIILKYVPDPDIYEFSAIGKFKSVANIVYNHPELIHTFSDDGKTPADMAAEKGFSDIARILGE